MQYRTRTLERAVLKANRQFPAVLVTGPRQVGKTSLLRHLGGDRNYVTLDDPLLRDLAKREPALFLQRFRAPVLIDEIQYAPELLPLIKVSIDQDRKPGQFWLTGSQQFQVMKGVSESLAGRVAVLQLAGFTRRELLGKPQAGPFIPSREILEQATNDEALTLDGLYQRIWRGSLPGLHAEGHEVDRDLFLSSYVQTYLQRDIRDLANVGNELAFLRFLKATAARTGQLLNLADLSRDSDISQVTAKHWLSILVASGLVYLLAPWHSNLTKRLIKTPKLYFLDTGIAAWLTSWSSPATLEAGAMSGAFLETWVVSELVKGWWHQGREAPLYYYRDKDQKEIDVLIHVDGKLHPIEIKKSAQPSSEATRNFATLDGLGEVRGAGAVLCLIPSWIPATGQDSFVGVGLL